MTDKPYPRLGTLDGLMLSARLFAASHQLLGMFGGHRIWRMNIKPTGGWLYRTHRIFCSCGKEFE